MALINCPECSKEISNQSSICPNCGYPIKDKSNILAEQKSRTKPILIIGIILLLVVGITSGVLINNNVQERKRQEESIKASESLNAALKIYGDDFLKAMNLLGDSFTNLSNIPTNILRPWEYAKAKPASELMTVMLYYTANQASEFLDASNTKEKEYLNLLNKLNPPPKQFEGAYKELYSLYDIYKEYYSFVSSKPIDSYQVYLNKNQELYNKYMTALNRVRALLPFKTK